MPTNRRSFLKASAVTAAAAGLTAACTTERRASELRTTALTDGTLLDAVAAVVLPAELGQPGREAAISAFRAWSLGYE